LKQPVVFRILLLLIGSAGIVPAALSQASLPRITDDAFLKNALLKATAARFEQDSAPSAAP